ncbi:MAG: hypothetical protein D6806_01830, partial [Deltaproteobacteria bacterium]
MKAMWSGAVAIVVLLSAQASQAGPKVPSTRVCIDVKLHEPEVQQPAGPAAPPAGAEKKEEAEPPAYDIEARRRWVEKRLAALRKKAASRSVQASNLPIGQSPVAYLKRLFEHFVTHERGYEAARKDCTQRITVELYPLKEGWTAFARYSGNGREERVDQLLPDEISQFAERAVKALLEDVPISDTIRRDTVLRADSMKSMRRIGGTHHFELVLGTQVRGGSFATASDATAPAEEKIRVFSPMSIGAGYKGRFENWALETVAQVGVGMSRKAASSNEAGGHIDHGGSVGLALH